MAEGGLRQRPGDQPTPTASDGASVQDELIRRIEQRRELGRKRYGTDLRIFNGRDAVRDATEEALDLASYLLQVDMETQSLSADGGTGALVDILGRAGVDTSRDNIIRLSQIVERVQRWTLAQVTARTNRLARRLADETDRARALEFELADVREQLEQRTQERDVRQEQNEARVQMLLVAWEPCTPAWLQDQIDRGNKNACALTARAWVPGGSNHYHPRGVRDLLERQNAAEREVYHADEKAAGAGIED